MNAANYRKTTLNHPFIAQRADPYIMHHTDGSFYFTASVPEYDRNVLRRASTFAALGSAKETTIWHKHDQGIMSIHIWAPELHYLDGAWYIYFAAGDVSDKWEIRTYALYCPDKDPLTGHCSVIGNGVIMVEPLYNAASCLTAIQAWTDIYLTSLGCYHVARHVPLHLLHIGSLRSTH